MLYFFFFFFSSRRRHTRWNCDWSSDVCSFDLDAARLAAEEQADCLRELERTDAVATAARASFLGAFTVGKGYAADADYSAQAWLMHQTGITRGAASIQLPRESPST